MAETTLSSASAQERTERFAQAFNRLAIACREPVNDERVYLAKLEIYREALADLPIEAIEHAALSLRRRQQWFPKTGEWHEAAREAISARAREAQIQAPQFREEPWRFECRVCEDTGWERHDCTAVNRCGRPFCDRQGVEHKHSYVTVCPCRATNHTYQRLHQAYSGDAK